MNDRSRRALLFVATLAIVSPAAQAKQDKRSSDNPEDGSYTLGRVELVDPSLKPGEPLADPATLRAVGFTTGRRFEVAAVKNGIAALVERYQRAGYGEVAITPETSIDQTAHTVGLKLVVERTQVVLPKGSADYSKMLALAQRYKKKEITFDELQKRVVAEKLPPHRLGDEYLIAPVPAPPPGVPYEPGLMPPDWLHTFGEVTMTFWAGTLTRDEYDRLHKAAHGKLPGFPNCHPAP